MARLNDFMARIDLRALNEYVAANGRSVAYAKGDTIVRQGQQCRYVGVIRSGYFKYVACNSKGQEVVTGFSFVGEVVTDFVRGFLFDQTCLTTIVAGCDAEILRIPIDEIRRYLRERDPDFVADASSTLLQEAYCRYLDLLVKTPAERYKDLVGRYPGMMRDLPIQEMASYLGVSRRQLHRIREAESTPVIPDSEKM